LWGLAWSGMWIGANSMTLDVSNDLNRGQVNGRLQMWFFIGVALSSFCGGLFTDLFTYRGGLWVSTVLSALGLLVWIRYLPETRPRITDQDDRLKDEVLHNKTGFPWKLTITCSLPFFINRLIFTGVLGSTTILWLKQFVNDGHLSFEQLTIPLATMSGTFIAIRVLVSVLSVPQVGKFSDHLNRRWLVLAIIFVLFGAGGLFLLAAPNFWVSILGIILAAIAGGSIPALIPTLIGDQVQQSQQSRSMGYIFSFGDLGSALGPPIALSLVGFISLPTLFIGCSIILLLTGFFTVYFALQENHLLSQLQKT